MIYTLENGFGESIKNKMDYAYTLEIDFGQAISAFPSRSILFSLPCGEDYVTFLLNEDPFYKFTDGEDN